MLPNLVHCFRNEKGDYLLVPLAIRPGGPGCMVNQPLKLTCDVTDAELGAAVRERSRFCDYRYFDPAVPIPELPATGAKSYAQFAKRWHCVPVGFEPNNAITVMPSARDKKGVYWFLTDDTTELTADVENEELGMAIKSAFSRCYEGVRGDVKENR